MEELDDDVVVDDFVFLCKAAFCQLVNKVKSKVKNGIAVCKAHR